MQTDLFVEMAGLQDRHWWFAARRRILADVIHRLPLPASAEILEIGCGTGANLAMLAGFGCLYAMEHDDMARDFAMSLGICPVAAGGLPEPVPFPDRSFDLVCLLDVLEHIENDTAALTRIARLLRPGGMLLVTVPAYGWLWSGHDTAHHHFQRYTAGVLAARARQAGFRPLRLGYFNTLLFPLIAAVRLLQRLGGRAAGEGDMRMPSRLANALLQRAFGCERHILPRFMFPFGTSVLAVLVVGE